MADRKVYEPPPASEAPPYISPEELAAAARPASMVLDRRGGGPQLVDIPPGVPAPAKAPPASQGDVRKVDNAIERTNPSAFAGVVPGLPQGPAAPAASPFTTYDSTNPESRYDKDVELTHTLSRMLGMAGLGEKAAGMRDLHMKLQTARMDDLGEQAQRAFLVGDVTKGIDVFNHAVPNGQKITGYRKNADGTIAFQMADGRTETKTPSQLADTITSYRNPEVMSTMMRERSKMLAETSQKMALAQFQGSIDMQLAVGKGLISHQNAVDLERVKAQYGADRITVAMDGTPWIAMRGGGVASMKMGKDLNGKPEWKVDQIIPQAQMGAQQQGAPVSGTRVDTSRVPLSVAPSYQ